MSTELATSREGFIISWHSYWHRNRQDRSMEQNKVQDWARCMTKLAFHASGRSVGKTSYLEKISWVPKTLLTPTPK